MREKVESGGPRRGEPPPEEMLAGKWKGELCVGKRNEGGGEKWDGRADDVVDAGDACEPIEVEGRRPGWIRLPSRTWSTGAETVRVNGGGSGSAPVFISPTEPPMPEVEARSNASAPDPPRKPRASRERPPCKGSSGLDGSSSSSSPSSSSSSPRWYPASSSSPSLALSRSRSRSWRC